MKNLFTIFCLFLATRALSQQPSALASSNPPVACTGQSIQLTCSASGGINPYKYKWYAIPGGVIDSIQTIVVYPSTATLYSVVVTNGAAPFLSTWDTVMVAIGSPPSFTVSPQNPNACTGQQITLTANGAVSYSWNTSSTASQIVVSPNITTSYTVTGASAYGCKATQTLAVVVLSDKGISGPVTSTAGSVAGSVTLYRYHNILTKFDSISTVPISGGNYAFSNIQVGTYLVRATPSSKQLLDTYGPSAAGWKDAAIIGHNCFANSVQNINVQVVPPLPKGPGSLSGRITKGIGYKQKSMGPGDPIGGLTVKGGRNPGGNTIGKTTTDPAGYYKLDSLQANTGGESYYILVDIPGLDSSNTYHRVIIQAEEFGNLDFVVDSAKIRPTGEITSIKNREAGSLITGVYPSPTNGALNIECHLDATSTVEIQLVDITGRTVKTMLQPSLQAAGSFTVVSGTHEFDAGLYFVRLKSDKQVKMLPVVISK